MIIQCESCSRKFIVKDKDIPEEGRAVQCGYCSVTWHQMPNNIKAKAAASTSESKIANEINDSLSVEKIKASDGKTYKFLGSQWAELLPSGKTGIFAKKRIGKELDKLTGRKEKKTSPKKRSKKELNPSSESLNNEKQLPDIYKPRSGLGLLGYIFIIIIVSFSAIGIIKTFQDDWLNYFPQDQYIFDLIDEQLIFVAESVKNIIVLIKDLINSY